MSYQFRYQRPRNYQHPGPGPQNYNTTRFPVNIPYHNSPGSGYYTTPQQHAFIAESFMIAFQVERQENLKLREKLSKLQLADKEEINNLKMQVTKEMSKNAEKDEEIKSLKLQITQLDAKKNQLECDLEERVEQVKALLVLQEMLMTSIEKRDEMIIECKTMLKKYTSSSLPAVSELKDCNSPSTLTLVEHQQQSVDQTYETYIPSNSIEELESNFSASLTETEFMSPVAAELPELDDNESTSISINWSEESLSPVAEDHQQLDSNSLNDLFAVEAENTMGPWLCLPCGKDGQPLSLASYSEFRRHLIDVHQKKIDPALCEICGFRSQDDNELNCHRLYSHNIQPNLIRFLNW